MSDNLQIPEVPEAHPEDPEDVSWALSTAEAMWARGDHSEGIKWVRRAAEAASEAEKDERALQLAKAAADLAGMISRTVSRGSIDLEEVVEAAPPPVPPARMSATPNPPSKPPAAAPKPGSIAPKALTPSRAPAPLPSQASNAPTPIAPAVAPRGVAAPRPASVAPVSARPKTSIATPVNPIKPPASVRGTGSKRSRKSRENLENEAKEARGIARVNDTLRHPKLDSSGAPVSPVAPPSSDTLVGSNDATVVGNISDLLKNDKPSTSMRAVPAAAATNGSLAITKAAKVPAGLAAAAVAEKEKKPTSSVAPPTRNSVSPAQHDPNIVTSQAVRVVVWRDATGIRVAPAGTVVSAITIDAVLVALEPNADLTAWLGGPERA